MSRHYRSYPVNAPKKQNYHKLFTLEDEAKLAYNRDMAFRYFVNEWHAEIPELMGWELTDFYCHYKFGRVAQLSLDLA